MTMYTYGQQINWILQFWIAGINGDNVATCPYLARDTCIQRGMIEMKQDPYIYIGYKNSGFIFIFVGIYYT